MIELFGRYSGETSLITAYLGGADRAVISEVPFDVEKLAWYLVEDKRRNPSNYSMVTISEGATISGGEMMLSGEEDAFGHRKLGGIGSVTGELIGRITGEGIVLQHVAYLMRSGSPDSLDLMVATNYAVMAADLVLEGASGRMVALRGGHLHERADRRHPRRREAGRRRRALRRRGVPSEGPPRRRQADVPLLRRWSGSQTRIVDGPRLAHRW